MLTVSRPKAVMFSYRLIYVLDSNCIQHTDTLMLRILTLSNSGINSEVFQISVS